MTHRCCPRAIFTIIAAAITTVIISDIILMTTVKKMSLVFSETVMPNLVEPKHGGGQQDNAAVL